MENKPAEKDSLSFSNDELTAFKNLLNAFIAAVKNACVYSVGHPSTAKWAGNLHEAIDKLSMFRKDIVIGVTTEGLLLDGRYFMKDYRPYKDIALYLHRRYIESLKIETSVDLDNILKFITVLAMIPEELSKSGGVNKTFTDRGGLGIHIKQLDYSILLNAEVGDISKAVSNEEDIWKFLVSGIAVLDTQDSSKMEKISEVINNSERMRQLLNAVLGTEKADIISKSLLEVGKYLEHSHPEKTSSFVNNLVRGILDADEDFLKSLSGGQAVNSLKAFALKHMKKGDLLELVTSHIMKKKEIDDLLLNFMSQLASGIEANANIDLPGALADQIDKKRLMQELPSLRESVRKLFSSRPNDRFISKIYRQNLSFFLKDNPYVDLDILKEYEDDLKDVSINIRYFGILLIMLKQETELQEYKRISSDLLELVPGFIQEGKLGFIRELIEFFEKETTCSGKPVELQKASGENKDKLLGSEVINEIWLRLFSFDEAQFKEAAFILIMTGSENLNKAIDLFLAESSPANKKRLNYLIRQFGEESAEAFGHLLERRLSLDQWIDIIKVLGSIYSRQSQEVLIALYNKGNKLISLEILQALRSFPNSDINFLFTAVQQEDYFIRKAASEVLISKGSPEINKRLVKTLLIPSDLFFTKDKLLVQNVELIGEFRINEAVSDLASLLKQRRIIFRKRLEAIRLAALKALFKIGSHEAIDILSGFASDKSRQIREYVQMIKGGLSLNK